MKIIIAFLCVGGFLVAGTISESFKIKGMHCQYGCVNKVKQLMTSLDGVEKCDVDFNESLMSIQYDDQKINSELILSTMTDNTTFETRKVEEKAEKKSFWSRLKGIFS